MWVKFSIVSTSLDTIDSSVTCNILHFHLFINPYSHQILLTSYAESRKTETIREIVEVTHAAIVWPVLIGVTLTMQQLCKWPRLSAGNQDQKSYEYWWNKVLQLLQLLTKNWISIRYLSLEKFENPFQIMQVRNQSIEYW